MRRPSPALIVASIAVFVALGDVAMGASHYLITSKAQFSPAVLRALRGPTGKRGPAGPARGSGAIKLTYVSTAIPYKFDAITSGSLACPSGSFPVGDSGGVESNSTQLGIQIDRRTGFKFSVLDGDSIGKFGGHAYVFGVCASGPGLTAVDDPEATTAEVTRSGDS